MSKPVPVHAGSARPCSPACALLSARRCLTASRIAPPVHGVSTTRVTTAKLPPTPADQPGRRSGAPHLHSVPRIRDQRIWPCGTTAGTIANVCPAAQIADSVFLAVLGAEMAARYISASSGWSPPSGLGRRQDGDQWPRRGPKGFGGVARWPGLLPDRAAASGCAFCQHGGMLRVLRLCSVFEPRDLTSAWVAYDPIGGMPCRRADPVPGPAGRGPAGGDCADGRACGPGPVRGA
jgi:hypothetical protein